MRNGAFEMTDKTVTPVPVGSDGWPDNGKSVFVIRPGGVWLPFDSVADAVRFEREHATPSRPADAVFVLPGDGSTR